MSDHTPSWSDPHGDLGLQRGASDEEIKSAFRRLALLHHPDVHATSAGRMSAQFHFNKITAARNRLLGHRGTGGTAGPGGGAGAWAGARAGAGAGAGWRAPPTTNISGLGFALVLAAPLCLIGVVSRYAFPTDNLYLMRQAGGESMGRVNGLLEPPVNSWLRDDIFEGQRQRALNRPNVMTRISRRLFSCGTGGGGTEGEGEGAAGEPATDATQSWGGGGVI
jgi:hypothetical protein